MGKRRIGGIIAAGLASVLMLSGFDSTMTVEQLQENSMNALAGISSMEGDVSGNAHATLSISDGTEGGESVDVPIDGKIQASFTIGLEPLASDIGISYDANMMGQSFSGSIQMIIQEVEDGSGMAYMNVDSNGEKTGWTAAKTDAAQIEELKKSFKAGLSGDMSALSSSTAVADAGVDASAVADMTQKLKDQLLPLMQITQGGTSGVTGNPLYELNAEVTGDAFVSMVTEAMAAAGQELDNMSLEMVKALVGGLNLKMKTEIDSGTYLPFRFEIDMSDSDFSALGSLLVNSMMGAESAGNAQIDVGMLQMRGSFLFDNPVNLTIPQEALDAAANAASTGTAQTGGSDPTGTDPTGTDPTGTDLNTGDGLDGLIGGNLTGGVTVETDASGDDGLNSEPVMNPDGSYHLEYDDYSGGKKTADVDAPGDGMTLSYGSDNYLSFWDDGYNTIVYSLYSEDTEEETVRENMDVSYMEGNSDYSNIQVGEIQQTSLPDGRVVYYGTTSYTYGGYNYGTTYAAVKGANSIVNVELEYNDGNNSFAEATPEQIIAACSLVRAA